MQEVLQPWADEAGEIVFEYDIPRLGKRIDVVLLLRGIIFCLEFKVGQKDALQAIRRARFTKNYRFSLRGWATGRLLAVDLSSGVMTANAAALKEGLS